MAANVTVFVVVAVVIVVANGVADGVDTDAAAGEETDGEFCDAGDDDAAAKASAADFLA